MSVFSEFDFHSGGGPIQDNFKGMTYIYIYITVTNPDQETLVFGTHRSFYKYLLGKPCGHVLERHLLQYATKLINTQIVLQTIHKITAKKTKGIGN